MPPKRKLLPIECCGECSSCADSESFLPAPWCHELGEQNTTDGPFHPRCPLQDAPEPYSESNPPRAGDVVLFDEQPFIVLLVPPDTLDGFVNVQAMLITEALPIDKLTLLFRPKETE